MILKYRKAFAQAQALAMGSLGDNVACASNMKSICDLLNAIEPAVNARSELPQQVITVEFTQAVIFATGVTTQATNQAKVQFPRPGCVVGVQAGVLNVSASGFGMEDRFVGVQILVNGDRSLQTNGRSNTFQPVAFLGGTDEQLVKPWFPLDNRVVPSDTWFVSCQGMANSLGTSNGTFWPYVNFLFEPDLDLSGQ